MAECKIQKYPGAYPWHVESEGRFVRRCETKAQAQFIVALFSDAPVAERLLIAAKAYRLEVERAARKMDRASALKAARYWAVSLGFGPGRVNADPDTGEPLDPK